MSVFKKGHVNLRFALTVYKTLSNIYFRKTPKRSILDVSIKYLPWPSFADFCYRDGIYSKYYKITPNSISDSLTATIFDHLPEFLNAPDIISNPTATKLNIFERDRSKIDQKTLYS